jgi:hypothetical protein
MNKTISHPVEDFFRWYVLYDIPVKSVLINFENKAIEILIEDCDAESLAVELRLILKNVSKFSFNYPSNTFLFAVKAIQSVRWIGKNENHFEVNFLLDMERKEDNTDFTVGEMCIGFEDLDVIGGLTREQMLQKWREED